MANSLAYNISLPAASGTWIYTPTRDAPVTTGWNATYTQSDLWPWPGRSDRGQGVLNWVTRVRNAAVSLDFNGTGLILCLAEVGAQYTFTVDGNAITTTANGDSACAEYGSGLTLVARNLTSSTHRAELRVTDPGEDGMHFFGGVVTTNVDMGSDTGPVYERMIDDQDQSWFLDPGRGRNMWDSGVLDQAYELSRTFMCFYRVDRASASYAFRGSSALVLYGALYRDTHDYTVTLDGKEFRSDASSSGWSVGSAPLYMATGLDINAQHTLTITNFNTNNPECPTNGTRIGDFRSCCVSLDVLKLIGPKALLVETTPTNSPTAGSIVSTTSTGGAINTQAPPNQNAESSSTNVGAIAGGAVGGVIGGLLLFGLAFCLFRRYRREEEYDQSTRLDMSEGGSGPAAIRPYFSPPPPQSYQSSSSYQTATTPFIPAPYTPPITSKRGNVPYAHGQPPITPPTAPSHSSPPASSLSDNSQPQAAHASPLRQEDMDRVLQYVAAQMGNGRQGQASTAGDTALPGYH